MFCAQQACRDDWVKCIYRHAQICISWEGKHAKEFVQTKKAVVSTVSALRVKVSDIPKDRQSDLVPTVRSDTKSGLVSQDGQGGTTNETIKKKPVLDSTVIGIIKLRMYCKNEHIKAERILVSSTDHATFNDNLERTAIYSYMTFKLGQIIESATGIMPKGY